MLSLPPPPPPPPPPSSPPQPPPSTSPPPRMQATPISLDQIVISKQAITQQNRAPVTLNPDVKRVAKPSTLNPEVKRAARPPTLYEPQPRRTNPFIWCCAVICLIFSLLLIFFGVATLIIFLVFKPRSPSFDIPNANLNTIYFDSPQYFNGDLVLLANFSNPNRKTDVRFEYLDVELFFNDRLIATQAGQPFTQRRGETRLASVHFISSLVFLPPNLAEQLQKQVQGNRISYSVRGTFKVKATMGVIHFSYWLHSRCQVEMTGPPTGVLLARNCITKR